MIKLNSGDRAPNFEAPDQQGKTVRLTDFAGRSLFLFFYPKANTSG
jgi:thioredoxin-dependent peroxiredoxin